MIINTGKAKNAFNFQYDTDGLVQDCSNSFANALELLQSCTKPSIYLVIL